jgi:F-type H+-transporting ATPase subunit delta
MALSRVVPDTAQALIEAAMQEKHVPRIVNDVQLIRDSFHLERGLWMDLQNVAIPLKDRQDALSAALKEDVHPFVLSALLLLQEHGVLKNLDAFVANVLEAALRLADHYEVRATTAAPLPSALRDELQSLLEKQLKGTISLEEKIDPAVIGGIRLDIGDERIDATIQGTCKRLHQALYV